MSDKLLRCPFCGSEAKLFHSETDNKQQLCWVECTNDNCISTADFDTEEEAIEKWNKRCYNKDSWTIDIPELSVTDKDREIMNKWIKDHIVGLPKVEITDDIILYQ